MSLIPLAIGSFVPPPKSTIQTDDEGRGGNNPSITNLPPCTPIPSDKPNSPLPLNQFPLLYGAVRNAFNLACQAVVDKRDEAADKEAEESLRTREVGKLKEQLAYALEACIEDKDFGSLTEKLDLLRIQFSEFNYSIYYALREGFDHVISLASSSYRERANLSARALYYVDRNRFSEERIVPAFIKRQEDKTFFIEFLKSLEPNEVREFLRDLRELDYKVFDINLASESGHQWGSAEYAEVSNANWEKRRMNKKDLAASLLELRCDETGLTREFIFNSMLDGADIRIDKLATGFLNDSVYDSQLDRQTEIVLYMMQAVHSQERISFQCLTRLYESAITDKVRTETADLILGDNYFGVGQVSDYFKYVAMNSSGISLFDLINAIEESSSGREPQQGVTVIELGEKKNNNFKAGKDLLRCRRLHAIEQYARLEGPYPEGRDVLVELTKQDDPLVVNKACEMLTSSFCGEEGISDLVSSISSQIENGETCLSLACILRNVGYPRLSRYEYVLRETLSRNFDPLRFEEAILSLDEAVLFSVNEDKDKQSPTTYLEIPKLPALVLRILKPFVIWLTNEGTVSSDRSQSFKLNGARIIQCAIAKDLKSELRNAMTGFFNDINGLVRDARQKNSEADSRKGLYDEESKRAEAHEAQKRLELNRIFLIRLLELVDISGVELPWDVVNWFVADK